VKLQPLYPKVSAGTSQKRGKQPSPTVLSLISESLWPSQGKLRRRTEKDGRCKANDGVSYEFGSFFEYFFRVIVFL